MSIDLVHFTPVQSLAGGVIIGAAVAVFLLLPGRIAGISGILGGLLLAPAGERAWRIAFLLGLVAAPALGYLLGTHLSIDIAAGWGPIAAAGFLVGLGTRYGAGCTRGHRVCGISRGSVRSLVATATFMAVGMLTVFIRNHLLGG